MRRALLLLVALVLTGAPQSADANGSLGFENWVFWFHNNREVVNPPRTLPKAIDERALKDVLPTAMWATDAGNAGHQAIQGSAYIALGKLAREREHVDRLLAGASKDPSHDLIAIERATLGLGLLRRSDPARQFDAATLDEVRDHLFGVVGDGDYQSRARGFAALAIGLLGDQQTAEGQAERTTDRLFALLRERYDNPDIPIGILMAIGAQDPATLSGTQRGVLTECLYKGRLFENDVQRTVQATAAETLGRIGTNDEVRALLRMSGARRTRPNVQRSALVALGTLVRSVDAEQRATISSELRTQLDKRRIRDVTARTFARLAMARVTVASLATSPKSVETKQNVRLLLDVAENGRYLERSHAALALGFLSRAVTASDEGAPLWIRERSLVVLRDGLTDKKLDKRGQAAFAVALAIAGDEDRIDDLRALVNDTTQDHVMRGYAAWALAMLGANDKNTLATIKVAARNARSEEMAIMALDAWGIAGGGDGGAAFALRQLREARAMSIKGQSVMTLARIGDPKTIDDLVALVRDPTQQDLTRMIAMAGLGLLCDPEPRASLSRLTADCNYRLMTDLRNELFSVL